MKQKFGRMLALALALMMLCGVLVPAYAAAVVDGGESAPTQTNEAAQPAPESEEAPKTPVAEEPKQEVTPTEPKQEGTPETPKQEGTPTEPKQEGTPEAPKEETTETPETPKEETPETPETPKDDNTIIVPPVDGETEQPEETTEQPETDPQEEEYQLKIHAVLESEDPEFIAYWAKQLMGQEAFVNFLYLQSTDVRDAFLAKIAPYYTEQPTQDELPVEDELPAEEIVPVETAAESAEELYNALMACETLDEINARIAGLTDEQLAMMEDFTDEQNAALTAKMEQLGAYEISTLAEQISTTCYIAQGDSETVTKFNMSTISDWKCAETKDGIKLALTSEKRGYTIEVDKTVPRGTYVFHVSYKATFITSTKYEDTITVVVIPAGTEAAKVFYLKDPTYDPNSNNPIHWCDESIGIGVVDTDGAIWVNRKNVFNPDEYVVSMPEDMRKQLDGSWLLPIETYKEDYKTIFDAFKGQFEKDTGISDLTEEDIEAIYLTPHKISKNNSSNPDKHIDCKISVKVRGAFVVNFWVTEPDGTVKQAGKGKNYKENSTITKTDAAPGTKDFPDDTKYNGVTYKFDGWYNEADQKVTEDQWSEYRPTTKELEDGMVNFYAKYVPAETTLKVTKLVEGGLADTEKTFQFTYQYKYVDADGEEVTTNPIEFSLQANKTYEIKEIPNGAEVTVTEITKGYTTSWSYTYKAASGKTITVTSTDETDETDAKVCTLSVAADTELVFTNTKIVIPDTGVILDSLPYVLILAVVAAGVVIGVARKRRRDVDD